MSANQVREQEDTRQQDARRKSGDGRAAAACEGLVPRVVLTQFEWAAGKLMGWERLGVDHRKGLLLLLECQLDNLAEVLRVEIREAAKGQDMKAEGGAEA